MRLLNTSILAGKTKFVGHDGGMQANASQLELFYELIWQILSKWFRIVEGLRPVDAESTFEAFHIF